MQELFSSHCQSSILVTNSDHDGFFGKDVDSIFPSANVGDSGNSEEYRITWEKKPAPQLGYLYAVW
jgi:hypothetical protein